MQRNKSSRRTRTLPCNIAPEETFTTIDEVFSLLESFIGSLRKRNVLLQNERDQACLLVEKFRQWKDSPHRLQSRNPKRLQRRNSYNFDEKNIEIPVLDFEAVERKRRQSSPDKLLPSSLASTQRSADSTHSSPKISPFHVSSPKLYESPTSAKKRLQNLFHRSQSTSSVSVDNDWLIDLAPVPHKRSVSAEYEERKMRDLLQSPPSSLDSDSIATTEDPLVGRKTVQSNSSPYNSPKETPRLVYATKLYNTDIEHFGILGRGGTANDITMATANSLTFACKSMQITCLTHDELIRLRKEVLLSQQFSNDNLVHVLWSIAHPGKKIDLYMEYFESNLQKEMHRKFGSKEILCVVRQIAAALNYLHTYSFAAVKKEWHANFRWLFGDEEDQSKGFVHCDVKPENILMHVHPEWTESKVKLCDFGELTSLCSAPRKKSKKERRKSLNKGTLLYSAPETISLPGNKFCTGQYDGKIDVWALGIVIYQMIVCETPFQNEVDNFSLPAHIASGNRPFLSDNQLAAFTGNPKAQNLHRFVSKMQSKQDTTTNEEFVLWLFWNCTRADAERRLASADVFHMTKF